MFIISLIADSDRKVGLLSSLEYSDTSLSVVSDNPVEEDALLINLFNALL